MKKVLVTGANGQLGRCLQVLSNISGDISFLFTDSNQLDIRDKEKLHNYFLENDKIDYVINCAAYTNVENAEKESKDSFLVNAEAVKNVAEVCQKYDTILLHISTDYVFDGNKNTPYTEEDIPNPINEYGKSKLLGEQYIQEIQEKYFIIRTSWLYSQFGKNFYQTIVKKSKTDKKLTITTAEIGTPTNANDLAKFLIEIIKNDNKNYGLYHFSNLGSATWFDFAEEILKILGKRNEISLEKTDNYPTFAERPKYSVLSKKKITGTFNSVILNWKISLKELAN
ncbi:dTDP-4-dehydrorhamnose reductase [uncultured Aquimarina sp.]|uniref:dTDP-4-dehydrorhamnose reductase n=1 Tax=uncultured Aquimarina sp. TaxID=575652 RepID=UPI00262ACCBD|nr:dTDP-4-dehydrorhamnose reductase [uncultured Aquimarina sp.]